MRISDPRAIRAMAHPLRLDLLELLSREGSATAASCAKRLGESQASCSFHLRQLAKYGFVETTSSADRRERPWRLTDVEQSWSAIEGGKAATQLSSLLVRREADRILRWRTTNAPEPEAWRRAAFFGGATIPVTAGELDDLRHRLRELLDEYGARITDRAAVPEDARDVRILLAGTPL